ncbi:transcriptional regulator domain-containing protein [Gluconacetobacter sacchari]|uniref:transcriptional regulator domain-containing protein n=1 Tax=Gluconacetobacter sacchari TaxID=92759 RepID=UPI0039B447F2
MLGAHWHDQARYDYLRNAIPAELGWEYLRRNRRYRDEQRACADLSPDDPAQAEFARRWGPRFRRRS